MNQKSWQFRSLLTGGMPAVRGGGRKKARCNFKGWVCRATCPPGVFLGDHRAAQSDLHMQVESHGWFSNLCQAAERGREQEVGKKTGTTAP